MSFSRPTILTYAIVTHHSKIAAVHPARRVDGGGRRFGIVPVAKHHDVPSRAQLSRLTAWKR